MALLPWRTAALGCSWSPRPSSSGRGVLARATHLGAVLVARGAAGPHLTYEDRCARARTDLVAAATSRDDPAFWLYSSGSTGRPRPPSISSTTWSCAARRSRATCSASAPRTSSSPRPSSSSPMASATAATSRQRGRAVRPAPQRMTPALAFEVLARHRPTLFFAGPALYAAMLAFQDAPPREALASLRLCVSAGESLPADIFLALAGPLRPSRPRRHRTTEALHMFISNRPGAFRPGSSGQPVPGYEAAIVDEPRRARHARGHRQPPHQGRLDHGRLLEPAREDEGGPHRRLDGDGGQVLPGPRRYYWYWRPQRRHAQGEGSLGLAGGGGSRCSSSTRRSCRRPSSATRTGRLVKAKAFVVLKDPSLASEALAAELMASAREKLAPYKCPRWWPSRPSCP